MRPSYLQINLKNLVYNFKQIRKFCPNSKILAAVKANAYGHGLLECSKILEENSVDYLGVAFIEEGVELRNAGIKTPILTLGGISGRQIDLFLDYEIDILASSVSKLEQIENRARDLNKIANIHLKFDTGMERIGIHYYSKDVELIIKKATSSDFLNLVGIASHFALSESTDTSFNETQLQRFSDVLRRYENLIPKNVIRHIANSGGILSSPNNHLDMVRPGRILYGISAGEHQDHKLAIKPVLSLLSEVAYFKVVKKNHSVSYGRTWTAEADTRVVTIPLGYGDGIFRSLSNKGRVIINNNMYPIIGTICMDQFMVDIGPQGVAHNGDKVIFIGEDKNHKITITDIAKLASTDALEILTHLNTRLPRVYIDS